MLMCFATDLHAGIALVVTKGKASDACDGDLVGYAALQRIMRWSASLVELGVTLLLCQKCVHPAVKSYLLEQVTLHCEDFLMSKLDIASSFQVISIENMEFRK